MKYCALLACGEGERLQGKSPFKPLVPIGRTSLLEIALKRFENYSFRKSKVIFNEKGKIFQSDIDKIIKKSCKENEVSYFFALTPSSLHSIFEVYKKLMEDNEFHHETHLLVSMVDTIVSEEDYSSFINECRELGKDESLLLTTSFVDDEKPLTVLCDEKDRIKEFQVPLEEGSNKKIYVTSGIYCFSLQVLKDLEACLNENRHRMRNFLKWACEKGHAMYAYNVHKTVDVDRPHDIEIAKEMLLNKNEKWLLLDFGGTIDSHGIHSRKLFIDSFKKVLPSEMTKKENFSFKFQDFYTEVDNKVINESLILKSSLLEMNEIMCDLLAQKLEVSQAIGKKAANLITEHQLESLNQNREVLRELSKKYKLGVVSNFSGNLKIILEETNILPLVEFAVDSYYLPYKKPSIEIFEHAANLTNVPYENCTFVGDNIERDILPAKKLGMKTVLVQDSRDESAVDGADFSVGRLSDLLTNIQSM